MNQEVVTLQEGYSDIQYILVMEVWQQHSLLSVINDIFLSFREGHNREDFEDHDISEYRPPRKKT